MIESVDTDGLTFWLVFRGMVPLVKSEGMNINQLCCRMLTE